MPKLSDAINKVNQEEAQRKRPVKRRPYLDNLVSSTPLTNEPDHDEPLVKKTSPVKDSPKTDHPKKLGEKIKVSDSIKENLLAGIPVKEMGIGEGIKTSQIITPAKELKNIPEPVEKPTEEKIITKPILPQEEIDEVEEVYEVDLESQSFNFLPSPVEQKLKPVMNFLDGEIKSPPKSNPFTDPALKRKPIQDQSPKKTIRPFDTSISPQGTMGSDEEDGVDLSIINLEEFGETTKSVLLYIFKKAKENKGLVTPALKKTEMQKDLGVNFNTIRTVLRRLSHYKFIKLEKYQRGRFGWTRYSMRQSLYNELLYNFEEINSGLKNQTPGMHPLESGNFGVGEDITIPNNLLDIGFNMGHIKQLQKMQITTDKIQRSLDAFAFDMQDKEFKTKIRTPLNLFMKVAKSEGEYISSRGYVSPEDEIMQQMIQLKKDRALHAKKQQDELLNLNFEEWLTTKTKEEIITISPPTGDYLGPLHKATLKNWYFENVFQG